MYYKYVINNLLMSDTIKDNIFSVNLEWSYRKWAIF